MRDLKPIETRYKGYRFRSRLEARWAVFFDAMGLTWEYEPEGFDLPGGVPYLPDFRIGEYLWLEVKGQEPSDAEQRKAELLAQASAVPVAIGIGQPTFGDLWVYCADSCDGSFGWNWWTHGEWRSLKGDDTLCIGVDAGRSDRSFVNSNWEASDVIARIENTEHHTVIARAAESARGARFEHGEKGISRPAPTPTPRRESWEHAPPPAPFKQKVDDVGPIATRWSEVREAAVRRFSHVGKVLDYLYPSRLLPGGVLEVEPDPFEPLDASLVGAIIDNAPLTVGVVSEHFTGILRVVVHLYPTQIETLVDAGA